MSLTALAAWFRSALGRLGFKRRRSYEGLLAERERMKEIVLYWRYPDGSLVPQEKRQRMFHTLREIKRQIGNHPDNPERRISDRAVDAKGSTVEAAKSSWRGIGEEGFSE